jgi:hypothetical protein
VELFVGGVGKPVCGAHKALPRGKAQSATQNWLHLLPWCRILQVSASSFYLTTVVWNFPCYFAVCVCVGGGVIGKVGYFDAMNEPTVNE